MVEQLKMITKHLWNDENRVKQSAQRKNLFQCHLVYHKFRTDKTGIKPGPPWWEASDYSAQTWHSLSTDWMWQQCSSFLSLIFMLTITISSPVPPAVTFQLCLLPTQCTYVLYMILWINSHSFSKQQNCSTFTMKTEFVFYETVTEYLYRIWN